MTDDEEITLDMLADERVDVRDVIGEVLVTAARDAIGLAEAAQIRREDTQPRCGELRRDQIERSARVHEPVQNETRRAWLFVCPLEDGELETISARAKSSHGSGAIL